MARCAPQLLAAAVLAAAAAQGGEPEPPPTTCHVDSPSGARLRLPLPGEDACAVLREHCGGGREGALCLKSALEKILPDDEHVRSIRAAMRVPLEFHFLCSPPAAAAGGGGEGPEGWVGVLADTGSERAAELTAVLRRASALEEAGDPAAHAALADYQR